MKPGSRLSATAAVTLPLMALVPCIASSQTTPPPCNVEKVKSDASLNAGLVSALSATINTNRCSSLVNVLKQITNGTIKAGRKLEGDTPFDATAAESQLKAARADPEIQAAIEAELQGVASQNLRLLLEAVVMHDKRKLLARDLLIRQLDARGRP